MSGVLALPRATVAAPRAAVLVVAAGCAALTARPLLIDVAGGRPASVVGVLFLGLLAVGLLWPERSVGVTATPNRLVVAVLALGIGAFAVGRVLVAGSPSPASPTAFVIGLNMLAAVAEEAFFRRLAHGALLAGGPVAAVVGTAVLFAAVHVTVYGLWVLPLDLAAGLLFGWQRQASGTWAVPAVTHAVANLAVLL